MIRDRYRTMAHALHCGSQSEPYRTKVQGTRRTRSVERDTPCRDSQSRSSESRLRLVYRRLGNWNPPAICFGLVAHAIEAYQTLGSGQASRAHAGREGGDGRLWHLGLAVGVSPSKVFDKRCAGTMRKVNGCQASEAASRHRGYSQSSRGGNAKR